MDRPKNTLHLVLLAAFAVLLGQPATLATAAPVPGDPPPELRLVLPDTFAVFHVHVSGLLSRELPRELAKLTNLDRGLARSFGAPLDQIDGIAFLGGVKSEITVITTRKPYDRDQIIQAILRRPVERTHQGKKFYSEEDLRKPPFPEGIKDFKKEDGPAVPPPPPPGGIRKDKGFVFHQDRKEEPPRPDRTGREEAPWARAVYFLSARTFVTGRARDIRQFIEKAEKPDGKHPLSAACATAGKHHVTVGMEVPEELRAQMQREMGRELRRMTRREPLLAMVLYHFKPFAEAKGGLATLDVGEDARLDARVHFTTAAAAQRGEEASRFLLQLVKGFVFMLEEQMRQEFGELKADSALLKLTGQLRAGLNEAHVKVDEKTIKVALKARTDRESVKAVRTEITPLIQAAALRTITMSNLRQLVIAMQDYADSSNGRFVPTGALGKMPVLPTLDKNGKPSGLSWRVHLLPFIEQGALYRQFKLDEPWDSEHNKKLIVKMPQVFAAPGIPSKEPGLTYYQVFANYYPNGGRFPASIPDGTSQTLAIVEAATPVIWTKPDDIEAPEKQPVLPKLGGLFRDGFHAVFWDGHARFFRKDSLSETSLRALMTPNGNDLPGQDVYGDDEGDFRGYKKAGEKKGDIKEPPPLREDRPKEKPPSSSS
ncbi:MAG: DUF1559 domain-containing protein [Planctomycetes bacterium]|nr:DUF1559 domain-containing protein [Planctomycetota bacterium]